ncbi:DUF177 domain-containing protein [bacterium]|nr:DUF177 domain-containing protein [bacterium]
MKVKLFNIDESPTHFEFQFTRENLQKLEERYQFQTMECVATLTKKQEFIELKGTYRVRIKTFCDLCLVPVSTELDESFLIGLISENDQKIPEGDLELSLNSFETDCYQGEEIDLITYFEDQLILDLPLAVTCSEDCKGLCSVCGTNRNESNCNCLDESSSSPFAVLKDLKPD